MNGYFKPLRRKIGVLMLVTSCVFMAGWRRSLVGEDSMSVRTGRFTREELVSGNQTIAWISRSVNALDAHRLKSLDWRFVPYNLWPGNYMYIHTEEEMNWPVGFCGFGFNEGYAGDIYRVVPYWSIVIPLTLLSAWLLLSNPKSPAVIAVTQPLGPGL